MTIYSEIKELEFDRAMGKVAEADFVEMHDFEAAKTPPSAVLTPFDGADTHRVVDTSIVAMDEPFMPTRIVLGAEEYAYHSSMIIQGHGAVLPGRIRELRAAGKKTLIVERSGRYYVFLSPA